MAFEVEFEIAKTSARLAGELLCHATEKTVLSAIDHDIKLDLDIKAEKLILTYLKKLSSFPVLGEETGLSKQIKKGEPYWIVDPIDGTLNFVHEIPFSSVSIALWKDDKPIIGVVYDFHRGEMIASLKNKGVFFNGKQLVPPPKVAIKQAILATGFPSYLLHDTETLKSVIDKIKKYKKIRLFGSAALSSTYVALGRVHAYFEDSIKLWDVAAGIAICEELGIKTHYTSIENNEFLYTVEIKNLE
ncbi:MAG: inositol monophosphatase family protein [Oceanospirillaceae bacterium]|nr:inositol monophosphatase family protein [Colwellia sp.]NQZ32142.1 inositol monophosphatase family protein [Oceanospirillaceae bacterium]